MSKYKAIGFDHRGVIAGMSAKKFHQVVCEVIDVEEANFIKAYRSYNTPFNEGKITKENFWHKVLLELNKENQLKKVLEIVDRPTTVNSDVLTVIKQLRKMGFKLGILSNDTVEGGRVIRKDEHLEELFDLILVSGETGLAKPNKEAFDDFVNKLGVLPGELIYIDDSKANITTANELGIETILCVHSGDVRKGLEEKGVL